MVETIAVTLFGAHNLELSEKTLPPLADGMVRIRFGAGGICGSDLHYYSHGRAGNFIVDEPLILGHEISGEIAEISGAYAGLSVGKRVSVNPSRWCRHCSFCTSGRPNLCENIFFMGSASKKPHMQGGFASYFDVIPEQCHVVSDRVSFEAAALAEPLAVCLHAVARAGNIEGKAVTIYGGGPIGLLTMLCARRAGAATITVVDVAPVPLAFARTLGADHVVDASAGGEQVGTAPSPDVVFEVTGVPAVFGTALAAVRPGGTVVQIGNLPGGNQSLPISNVMAKEIDVRGSFRFGDEFSEAVRLIETGEIDVLSIVTGSRQLTKGLTAFDEASDRNTHLKLMLIR